jgi:putative transposase
VKFEMVRKLSSTGPVDVRSSCQTLEVSRSGYYAWRDRPESERTQSNRELVAKMRKIHAESRETYGSPRMTEALRTDGHGCSRTRVARLMRKAGIAGVAKRRYRVMTTDSNHPHPIAERVFQVEDPSTFPARPNAVWASDITYVPTEEGWLYLAIQLDVFTRKIVGYSMTESLRTEGVLDALRMAMLGQGIAFLADLVTHSDRGCQYASEAYREQLKAHGITASMSRRGNCYDNAYAESFFHSLKVELVHRRRFQTRAEAAAAIFEYIEVWYNRRRLHSSLGYRTPVEYEQTALRAA